MTSPSTANSKDTGGVVQPVAEHGSVGPSATRSVVKGELAPRLPHERDESSDSGTREPSKRMLQAASDVQRGHTDESRGPETQQHYSDLTEEATRGSTNPP
jgi:hypothetical protein